MRPDDPRLERTITVLVVESDNRQDLVQGHEVDQLDTASGCSTNFSRI